MPRLSALSASAQGANEIISGVPADKGDTRPWESGRDTAQERTGRTEVCARPARRCCAVRTPFPIALRSRGLLATQTGAVPNGTSPADVICVS